MEDLREIVKSQKNCNSDTTEKLARIQKRIAMFKKYVDEFYNLVLHDWLKPIADDGNLTSHKEQIFITELTGEYKVSALYVSMGNISLYFKPIGTDLIGTFGRIDMYVNGNNDPAMFILAGERAKYPRIVTQVWVEGEPKPKLPEPEDMGKTVWKYVDRNGRIRYVSLNAKTFQDIIVNRL